MKKLLFLLLLGVFPLEFIVGNTQCYNVNIMACRRQIALKGKAGNGDKTTRAPYVYPVEVFIENNMLSLDFLSKRSSVFVTVINVTTNDIIYKNNLSMYSGILLIDLKTERTGGYKLILVSGDYDLSGDFVLE